MRGVLRRPRRPTRRPRGVLMRRRAQACTGGRPCSSADWVDRTAPPMTAPAVGHGRRLPATARGWLPRWCARCARRVRLGGQSWCVLVPSECEASSIIADNEGCPVDRGLLRSVASMTSRVSSFDDRHLVDGRGGLSGRHQRLCPLHPSQSALGSRRYAPPRANPASPVAGTCAQYSPHHHWPYRRARQRVAAAMHAYTHAPTPSCPDTFPTPLM